jgi:hypothetical protein
MSTYGHNKAKRFSFCAYAIRHNIQLLTRKNLWQNEHKILWVGFCILAFLFCTQGLFFVRGNMLSVVCLVGTILSKFLMKSATFGKMLLKIKCVLWCSLQLWNTSHSKKNLARYYHNLKSSSPTIPFIFSNLIQLEFSTDFGKPVPWKLTSYICEEADGWKDRQIRRK